MLNSEHQSLLDSDNLLPETSCADTIEGFFGCFINLVTFCSKKKWIAALVAVSAELGFNFANAHAVMRLLHNMQDAQDPLDCVSIEIIKRNTLICWAIFSSFNLVEMRKAYQIITKLNERLADNPAENAAVEEVRTTVCSTVKKAIEIMFITLGTATRMGGTMASILVATQESLGAEAKPPKPCFDAPAGAWVAASAIAAVIGLYKGLWLAKFSRADKTLKVLGWLYSLFRNGSILTEHVTLLILAQIEARTKGESELKDTREQLIWLIGIVIVSGIFIMSQDGLNNFDALSRGTQAEGTSTNPQQVLAEQSQCQRIVKKCGAVVGAVGVAALTTTALNFLSAEGRIDTPRHPAPHDATLQAVVYCVFGILVYSYYIHRFLLGLTYFNQ